MNQNQKKIPAKVAAGRCEDCEFYKYYPEDETETCSFDLDEDEYRQFLCGHASGCPYYKPYDEYKSVQKQN